MSWLLARIRCWRRGHDWYLMTTDKRHMACHVCCKQGGGSALAAYVASEMSRWSAAAGEELSRG